MVLYGLSCSVLGPTSTFLTLVIFNGYEVFTRHNLQWNFVKTSWGFYVSSWVELGILILAFLGWLLYYYYAGTKEWSLQILQIPDLHNADITDGMAPTLPAREANGGQSGFTKVGSWILNNV